VLKKTKVMSYKGLEKAQAKRVVKDAAKAAKDKGKRGRKRKGATPEAEEAADKVKRGRKRKSAVLKAEAEAEEPEEPEPEPKTKMARTNKAPAPSRASVMQTPIAEDEIVPEPWRAPVAKMW
jgi:hypothetical protein